MPHEALVRRVLEQTPHEVGHARHQVADRHVDAGAHAELAHGFVQRFGHAVQHLDLDRIVGEAFLASGAERVGDAPQVVAGERGADVAGVRDEHRRAPFVVGVGLVLVGPHRRLPALRVGLDRLDVPVRALDQTDLQRAHERVGRPLDEVAQIVEGIDAVRLDDAAELRAVGVPRADLAQQPERDVLHLVVLGVEVDRHIGGTRRVEDRAEALERFGDPGIGGRGSEQGRERARPSPRR